MAPRPRHPEAAWDATWRERSACLGVPTSLFFEQAWSDLREAEMPGIDLARSICRACPVQEACMADALNTRDEYGVRAGSTPIQRRRIRRRGLDVPAALEYVLGPDKEEG